MARFVYSRKGLMLGSALQVMIHRAIDTVPDALLSPARKTAIKNCPGCGKRVRRLNKATASPGPASG